MHKSFKERSQISSDGENVNWKSADTPSNSRIYIVIYPLRQKLPVLCTKCASRYKSRIELSSDEILCGWSIPKVRADYWFRFKLNIYHTTFAYKSLSKTSFLRVFVVILTTARFHVHDQWRFFQRSIINIIVISIIGHSDLFVNPLNTEVDPVLNSQTLSSWLPVLAEASVLVAERLNVNL